MNAKEDNDDDNNVDYQMIQSRRKMRKKSVEVREENNIFQTHVRCNY